MAEFFHAPIGDQEFQAGAVAEASIAVVAEDAADSGPHVGNPVEGNPHTQILRQHGVGGQPAADIAGETGAVFGMDGADKRNVLDFMGDILPRIAGDGGFVFPRQVYEFAAE